MFFEITFHGNLGKLYGNQTRKIQADSYRAALNIIDCSFKGALRKTLLTGSWQVSNGERDLEKSDLEIGNCKVTNIYPKIIGAGDPNDKGSPFGSSIFALTGGLSQIWNPYVDELLNPDSPEEPVVIPFLDEPLNAEVDKKPSFLYNGVVNVAEQGGPIPLVFGEHLTGSVVISSGISSVTQSSAYTPIRDNFSFTNGTVGAWGAYGAGTTIQVVNQRLQVTSISALYPTGAFLPVVLISGESYRVTVSYAEKGGSVSQIGLGVNNGTVDAVEQLLVTDTTPVSLQVEFTFNGTETGFNIVLIVDGVGTCTFDNIDMIAATGERITL